MSHTHHTIDYLELSVGDLQAAKSFYTSAFGWALTDYGPSYAGIAGEGKEQGGLAQSDGAITAPLAIIYSDDLEASLKSVEQVGGTIVRPIYSFPGGRRFHFTDPSSNQLAVWSDRPESNTTTRT